MLVRPALVCLSTLALAGAARAQLIVSGPAGGDLPANSLTAWRVDVTSGASVPLWRNWPSTFAVNDADGRVWFPADTLYEWDYSGQSNPTFHGGLHIYQSGQTIPMSGATFANGSFYGVPANGAAPGGLYEIVLAPAGQTSYAHLRKSFAQGMVGLALDSASGLFYTSREGTTAAAGIWTFSLAAGQPVKIKSLPAGVTEVGGIALANGKLYLTPHGAGPISIYDVATGQYEPSTLQSPSPVASSTYGGAGWAPSLVPATPPPGSFCSPKNSVSGCAPTIHWNGFPSASATSGFVVHATGIPPLRPGLMLYQIGGPRSAAPFAGYGTPICFGPSGIRRSPPMDSGGTSVCSGTYALDMNAFAAGLAGGNPAAGLSVPGNFVYCRFWGRDTLAGFVQMSDALEYIVAP